MACHKDFDPAFSIDPATGDSYEESQGYYREISDDPAATYESFYEVTDILTISQIKYLLNDCFYELEVHEIKSLINMLMAELKDLGGEWG